MFSHVSWRTKRTVPCPSYFVFDVRARLDYCDNLVSFLCLLMSTLFRRSLTLTHFLLCLSFANLPSPISRAAAKLPGFFLVRQPGKKGGLFFFFLRWRGENARAVEMLMQSQLFTLALSRFQAFSLSVSLSLFPCSFSSLFLSYSLHRALPFRR